jgi:lipoate-protein ligase A
MSRRPAVHLLRLSKAVDIKDQLRLEEALLRHDTRNWCILKDGEPAGVMARPTIVLGIGGKAAKLVELERVNRDRVPLLRRFSGGGTVIVDHDSLFITFIMNTVSKEDTEAGVDAKNREKHIAGVDTKNQEKHI